MNSTRLMIKPIALACSLALAACSSGDDAATTTISGLVEAPGGQVAQFEHDKPMLLAATDLLFPPAHAGITGLQPVTGATVELIRIDDDGNQVGDVLATTVTSITGDYSLALPSGVSLAGNLIVRITGNGGASMSAMVVEQAVDINPISQYVLDKFVDDENLVLGDLAVNEVVALQNKVEEFDLTATADLTTMLAQLDAEVGELVDTEIAVLNSTPDDGSAAAALAGGWNSIEFGLGMHDSEQSDWGTLNLEVLSEGFTLAAGTVAGEISIDLGTSVLIDAWSGFNVDNLGNASIYHETSLTADGESLTGTIDSSGNIVIEYPFEEDLQTVSVGDPTTDPEADGPDYGWRWPSGSITLRNAGNDNALVYLDASAGVRYETTDTNNDGINDAVNPAVKDGDETEMFLGLLLKQGSGMSASSLAGDYGLVTLAVDLDSSTPLGSGTSTVAAVNFNAGTATVSTYDEYIFERSPSSLTSVTLTDPPPGTAPSPFPYAVTATGQVTLDTENDGFGPDDLQGWTNDDGSVVGLVSVTTFGNPITLVEKEFAVAVKLPTSAPSMANAVFKLYPITFGAEQTGLTETATLRSTSSLTFDATASTASADFTLRGFERATDVAAVEALVDPAEPPFDFTVAPIGANGAIDMTFSDAPADETALLKGFVSADGKMMVLRYIEKDETAGEKFRSLGMVIGIRQ